jgi:hypothetical protein
MIPNFFQSWVKIVSKIMFLQKIVQNVAKTFKKTAWQVILLYYIPNHRYRCLYDENLFPVNWFPGNVPCRTIKMSTVYTIKNRRSSSMYSRDKYMYMPLSIHQRHIIVNFYMSLNTTSNFFLIWRTESKRDCLNDKLFSVIMHFPVLGSPKLESRGLLMFFSVVQL